MLDGVRRQFIDQQAEGYGAIGVDIQRGGPDVYFDARRVPKQARGHGPCDFFEIGVHGDGPAAAGLRNQVVKLGNGADARLHGFVAQNAWSRRPSCLKGNQADDDLQVVLDPVRNLVRQAEGVAFALLAVCDVLEDKEHATGVVPGLRNLSGVQAENTATKTGKIVFDLEILDRLVFREHLLHQMAKRGNVPLVLT